MFSLPSGEALLPARSGDLLENDQVLDLIGYADSDLMGTVAEKKYTQKLLAKARGYREVPFCFEGGNVLRAMNKQGEIIYLWGSYNLLYSLLNCAFTFSGQEDDCLSSLSGLEGTSLCSEERIKFVAERLKKAKLLDAFPDEKEQAWIAKLCIAIIECTKEMVAQELKQRVLFLGDAFAPQPEFHLDMFLLPAPGGKIFIQSPSKCVELLTTILKQTNLTYDQRRCLKAYLHNAKQQAKREKESKRLQRMAEELAQAGFELVQTAGIFSLNSRKGVTCAINFLNSIVGMGDKGPFCIANGSGYCADHHLRKAFVELMAQHKIDLVYFTGRKTEAEVSSTGEVNFDYAEADKLLEDVGGIHCITQHSTALDQAASDKPSVSLPMPDPSEPMQTSLPNFFRKMLGLRNGS